MYYNPSWGRPEDDEDDCKISSENTFLYGILIPLFITMIIFIVFYSIFST